MNAILVFVSTAALCLSNGPLRFAAAVSTSAGRGLAATTSIQGDDEEGVLLKKVGDVLMRREAVPVAAMETSAAEGDGALLESESESESESEGEAEDLAEAEAEAETGGTLGTASFILRHFGDLASRYSGQKHRRTPGPRGIQGSQGPRGHHGKAGNAGEEGKKGPPGSAGKEGPPGDTGIIGKSGEAGSTMGFWGLLLGVNISCTCCMYYIGRKEIVNHKDVLSAIGLSKINDPNAIAASNEGAGAGEDEGEEDWGEDGGEEDWEKEVDNQ